MNNTHSYDIMYSYIATLKGCQSTYTYIHTNIPSAVIMVVTTASGQRCFIDIHTTSSVFTSSLSEMAHATVCPKLLGFVVANR